MTQVGAAAERTVSAGDVWRALRSLVLDDHDRRSEACTTLDLSFTRIKALIRVALAPIPMRELAELVGTDRPYMTVIVDDLEARGLVRRDTHPIDRRIKLVTVTADGSVAAARADAILNRPPDRLAAMTEADLRSLDGLLDQIAVRTVS